MSTIESIKTNLTKAKQRLAKLETVTQENTTLSKDLAVASEKIRSLEKELQSKSPTVNIISIDQLQQLMEAIKKIEEGITNQTKGVTDTLKSTSKESQLSISQELIQTEKALAKNISELSSNQKVNNTTLTELLTLFKKFRVVIPPANIISTSAVEKLLTGIGNQIKGLKLNIPWPTDAKNALPVRLSDGEKFYEAVTNVFGGGGGGSVPKVTISGGNQAVPVVNPDGTNVGGSGGDASAAKQDEQTAILTTINTSLDDIETDIDQIRDQIDLITPDIEEIRADADSIRVAAEIMDDWDNAASDGASVSGDVAHDSADAGEPVKFGMKAFSPDGTTPGTAVAENDRTDSKADLDGRQFINDEHPRWWSYHSNGSTALTDASVQADPGDGFQIVITDMQFSNGSTTAINMFLEEGSTTIWGPVYLEAINGRGYVWKGKKHVTASTALTVTTSGAVAHSVEILGYIQAV